MQIKKKKKSGFTLIELMIIVIIIGILVAVGMKNALNAIERAKFASLKSNMHSFQYCLEIYAIDWFIYPETAMKLKIDGINNGYWKTFYNPFSNGEDYGDKTLDAVSNTGITVPADFQTGTVGYISSQTGYSIYGGSKETGKALQYNGRVYELTNG